MKCKRARRTQSDINLFHPSNSDFVSFVPSVIIVQHLLHFAFARDIRQSIFLDLPIQRPFADAEHAGGFFAVAAGDLQRLGDEQRFDFGQRFADQIVQAVSPGR